MNEELRSATEELETSKEELQSVNEELVTVNNELKSSVEDLSSTNTDLNNLMASTDIGTIFLNRQLRIHRFTPSALKIFNLLPSDLERPLADITHRLDYPDFLADAENVLEHLVFVEREVTRNLPEADGGEVRWYLVRIAPYRTQEDRIAGVVATFIDISRRKRAEIKLRESEERIRLATRAARVPSSGKSIFRLTSRRIRRMWPMFSVSRSVRMRWKISSWCTRKIAPPRSSNSELCSAAMAVSTPSAASFIRSLARSSGLGLKAM